MPAYPMGEVCLWYETRGCPPLSLLVPSVGLALAGTCQTKAGTVTSVFTLQLVTLQSWVELCLSPSLLQALSPLHPSLSDPQASALIPTIPWLVNSEKQLVALLQLSPQRGGEEQSGIEICLFWEWLRKSHRCD